MTKRARQIYFLCVIIISIAILSYTLLSASGYVVNWTDWRLDKTGAISIDTQPIGASITISNGTFTTKLTSPQLVRDLFPGNYSISAELPGHTTWQSLASVNDQQTIFFRDIVLFRSPPIIASVLTYPTVSGTKQIQRNDLSPQIQYVLSQLPLSDDFNIIAKAASNIVVFDQKHEQVYIINTVNPISSQLISTNVHQVEWNQRTQQLLLVKPYELEIYSLETSSSWVLTRQSTPITEAAWFPNGHYVFIAAATDVIVLETRVTSSPNQVLLYHGVSPRHVVCVDEGKLLYLTDNKRNYELTIL